jgi:hypothetical protein
MRKIAIIGTGPGWEKAPLDWETWTISGLHDRFTPVRVYELHTAQEIMDAWKEKTTPQKIEWLKKQNLFIHPSLQTTFTNGQVFNYQKYLDKHGSYFTSSISWMLAEAIDEMPDEIGIFGVGMSSLSEYAHQKPGCTYLIGWAKALGIKVTIQEGSELLTSPYIYGLEAPPKILTDLAKQKEQMTIKKQRYEDDCLAAREQYNKAQGALDMIEYFENNFWAGSKK